MASIVYRHRVVLDVTPRWWPQHWAGGEFARRVLQVMEHILAAYPHCFALTYSQDAYVFRVTISVSDGASLEDIERKHKEFMWSLDALAPDELAKKERLP